MKIFIVSKRPDLRDFFLGLVFFLTSGIIFFIYSIDFSSLILAFILIVYAKFLRKLEGFPSYLDLSLLGALAIIIPLISMITFKLNGYGVSAVGFSLLITLLFENLELSFLFSLFISTLAASMEGGNFNVLISLLCASLVSSMLVFRVRRRFQVIKAGVLAGVVQFTIAFLMERQQSFFILSNLDFNLLKICLLNGLVSPIVVLGVLPIFEYIFKVVTNISLLELSDFNHLLLRRLILEAPGTYQHSLVVANLSEAAAEAIGANSLLVRVGAYYHDIGKVLKPEYFIENQISYRDIHKGLKPSMSKLIIINHVKEGVELAKRHRLNPRIIDFITQHHGRSLVYYFYHKAMQLEPQVKHEEEYRYPGPKPQSKETAIVSLADTVEALSRTLEEPTPSRIEEMVREVVKRKFMEGELDESNLTLKDLEEVSRQFIRVLNAIFHTRINYPKDENRNSKQAENKESKP